jgi:hypothetical protein
MGRYEDLIAKRDSEGLSEGEANELGQIIAEREGKSYANADEPPPSVEAERRSDPEEAAVRDEVETERDVDDSVLTEEGHKGREVDNPPVA